MQEKLLKELSILLSLSKTPLLDKKLVQPENVYCLVKSEESLENLTDEILEKYKNAPFRAPLIVILVSTKKDHPKVPRIEQIISTGTAGQNIMLALNALGYGAIWRTGRFAFNEKISERLGLNKNQTVIGYIYIGTPKGKKKSLPEMNTDDYISVWG